MDSYRFAKTGEIPAVIGRPGTTGSGNRFESELSCRFPNPVTCALEERRSRLFSSPFIWLGEAHPPPHKYRREAEPTCQRLVGSAANKRDRLSGSATASSCGREGGRPSCLCVFVFATRAGGRICVYLRYLRFLRMNEFVLICVICGQSGRVGGSVSLCLCGCSVFNAPESKPSGL